jgi:hypothetical protein
MENNNNDGETYIHMTSITANENNDGKPRVNITTTNTPP